MSLGLVPHPATWDRRTFWIYGCRLFILFEKFERSFGPTLVSISSCTSPTATDSIFFSLFPVRSHGASSGSGNSFFQFLHSAHLIHPSSSQIYTFGFLSVVPTWIFPQTFWTCGQASLFVGHFYPLRCSRMWFLLFIAFPFSCCFVRLLFYFAVLCFFLFVSLRFPVFVWFFFFFKFLFGGYYRERGVMEKMGGEWNWGA